MEFSEHKELKPYRHKVKIVIFKSDTFKQLVCEWLCSRNKFQNIVIGPGGKIGENKVYNSFTASV